MFDVSISAALLAGMLSFVSPCVLPIVPPYLCFLAGVSADELKGNAVAPGVSRRVVLSAVAFVLGFATVFVALGATASVVGQTVARHFDTLAIIAGVLIAIMGLHFLGVFRIGFLYREARMHVDRKTAGLIGAYLMGLAFAFGWTPCVGPILTAILFVAGSSETAGKGALLLAVYALGIGVPFILAAAFVAPFLRFANRFRRHLGAIERVMGGALVFTGVLFMTGQMSHIANWLLETFPVFTRIG
ncbi:cytochrome C biogenesis protein [Acuticoccus sediminis]|uniref:Cytochrome C biogenesis protein n=1 Tax=Acuticoccus sediminis TaxID=2184697 RepID=A0A8B2NRU2_9HYPH|nr:cytochrome c biogenesis protein CcdA [Acuticoccus sediminis]RAI00073.1 cytochrome C biogenesis protein [Acuticoccus sediminis]